MEHFNAGQIQSEFSAMTFRALLLTSLTFVYGWVLKGIPRFDSSIFGRIREILVFMWIIQLTVEFKGAVWLKNVAESIVH